MQNSRAGLLKLLSISLSTSATMNGFFFAHQQHQAVERRTLYNTLVPDHVVSNDSKHWTRFSSS
jgi:hypothetical protein